MRLPDTLTITCKMDGATHELPVTYQEELKENRIVITVIVGASNDFTKHVLERHLNIEGVPQHLENGTAEPPDVGDGRGARTLVQVTDVEELRGAGKDGSPGSDERSGLPAISATNAQASARDRLDLALDGE
jgi:hypothetical protein